MTKMTTCEKKKEKKVVDGSRVDVSSGHPSKIQWWAALYFFSLPNLIGVSHTSHLFRIIWIVNSLKIKPDSTTFIERNNQLILLND